MQCVIDNKQESFSPNGKQCFCSKDALVGAFCEYHFCAMIEDKIQKTITRFSLFTQSDKIFVAYSGGKDSTVLLYCLKKFGYQVEAITLNAYIGCYSKENVANAVRFCQDQQIPLHHISFREEFGYSLCYLRTILNQKGANLTSCTICGVLRRYLLNKYARQFGATKIAFGHNLDDEAQVVMMNLLRGNPEQLARLGPQTGVVHDARFVPRVKPLYFIEEQDIISYSKLKQFPVHYGACPCSVESFRYFVREIFYTYGEQAGEMKKNLVSFFLSAKPFLGSIHSAEKPLCCSHCGEPSSHELCRACTFLAEVVS